MPTQPPHWSTGTPRSWHGSTTCTRKLTRLESQPRSAVASKATRVGGCPWSSCRNASGDGNPPWRCQGPARRTMSVPSADREADASPRSTSLSRPRPANPRRRPSAVSSRRCARSTGSSALGTRTRVRAGFGHMFTAATVPGIAVRTRSTGPCTVPSPVGGVAGAAVPIGQGRARDSPRRSWNRAGPSLGCPCFGRCDEALAGLHFPPAPGHAAAGLLIPSRSIDQCSVARWSFDLRCRGTAFAI